MAAKQAARRVRLAGKGKRGSRAPAAGGRSPSPRGGSPSPRDWDSEDAASSSGEEEDSGEEDEFVVRGYGAAGGPMAGGQVSSEQLGAV